MVFKPLSCVCGKVSVPQRFMMVIMMQLALLNAYHLRVVLNLAMTEMMQPKNHTTRIDACPEFTAEHVEVIESKFDWPNWIEAFILYAFYIGYIFSHLPGGWLADKMGARHVMGTCMLASIFINLIYPICIQKGGYTAAIVLRVLLGFSQGPLLPAVSTFIQCWAPAKERALLGGIAFGGSNLGTVIGSIFTGVIIHKTDSWAMPFYIWGLFAMIWYIFYLFMVFSRPQTHPFITKEELEFLEKTLEKRKRFKVPWLEIAKSVPVWALLSAQFGHNYIFFTVLTDLPKYLKEVLKMNVQNNAVFTALPFLALWISGILFAYVANIITNKNLLSVVHARKLYTAFSLLVPSALLVATVYVGCNRAIAIFLYTLALFLIGPFFSGMKVNVNDLTMYYGGTIMALVNGLGATAGILGPLIVGTLTSNESLQEWRLVFWIMLGVSMMMSLIYVIFASADRQKWDYPEDLAEGER